MTRKPYCFITHFRFWGKSVFSCLYQNQNQQRNCKFFLMLSYCSMSFDYLLWYFAFIWYFYFSKIGILPALLLFCWFNAVQHLQNRVTSWKVYQWELSWHDAHSCLQSLNNAPQFDQLAERNDVDVQITAMSLTFCRFTIAPSFHFLLSTHIL